MDESNNPITPHHTAPPTSPPQADTPPSHSSTPIPPQPDTPPSHSSIPIPTLAQTQSHAQTVDRHTPILINNSSQTMSTHLMVTRAKAGIFKPLECMNYHVTTTSPLPRSHVHALCDPHWKDAMLDEYNALISNGTWVLVPRPANVNVVHSIPVVKPATIRTVLSLAVSRDWPIHQLDVNNAFLHGHLSEIVYMHQPPGFVDPNKPGYVCHLRRSFIIFSIFTADHCFPHSEFAMMDLGSLNYFLGISTQRSTSGLFLSQSKFAVEILERAHMHNCNPCRTPVDTESKLGSDGDPVCLDMHDPCDPHFTALKRILRYVRGTLDYGLQLHVSSTTQLSAYTDADWAGCPVTRRSTSRYCVFLGDNLLSWSAKRQVTLSRSSAEAEYRGVANAVAETAWIRNLLCELHTPLFIAALVYCDNISVVYIQDYPMGHGSGHGLAHDSAQGSVPFYDNEYDSPVEEVSPVKPKKPSRRAAKAKKDALKEVKETPKEWTVEEEIALCQGTLKIKLVQQEVMTRSLANGKISWKNVEMPNFYQSQGRKNSKTSETTSGSASGGLNLNEEADEAVKENQEFRPMGHDRAKAKKKAAGSSRGGDSSFVDLGS
nr:hypothetical protein [Tanacetum cinerariifolium]